MNLVFQSQPSILMQIKKKQILSRNSFNYKNSTSIGNISYFHYYLLDVASLIVLFKKLICFNTKGMNVYLRFEMAFHDTIQYFFRWHIIHEIAVSAQLNDIAKFTATKNRHRVSTLYAYMDLPESERDLFYRHMGHSKKINETVYQAPPALMEVVKVGKNLTKIDEGKKLYFRFFFNYS